VPFVRTASSAEAGLEGAVWVGEHWAMAAHGIGFGRYHDIRFVGPTTKDRQDLVSLLGRRCQVKNEWSRTRTIRLGPWLFDSLAELRDHPATG